MSRTSAGDRRRQLTEAAVAILIEAGPNGLTTRAVARRAGAPLGTVHYAFATKDELLAAAAGEILGSFAAALRERVDEAAGVQAAVETSLRSYWDWVRATPGLSTAVLETLVAGLRTSGAQGLMDAGQRVVLDVLEGAARHDAEPSRTPLPELARLMLIAADGLSLVHGADVGGERAEADLRRLTAMLQGLV